MQDNQIDFLPEGVFRKVMSSVDWNDTVRSDGNGNYRPYFLEGSIESMVDELIKYPYSKNSVYFVASNEEKGNTSQSFVRYYNSTKPRFLGLCYFPEMENIKVILPKEAMLLLPESLWQTATHLTRDRWDKREVITTKDGDPIIYLSTRNEIEECVYRTKPLFGQCVLWKVSRFIKVSDLSNWLVTKEGKKFQEDQLMKVLERDCINFHDVIIRKLTGSEIVSEALNS